MHSFGHCMYGGIWLPAYGHLGHALVILVVQICIIIKLDTYNTAYASCDTWTLYIFFSTLKLNSPGILILY